MNQMMNLLNYRVNECMNKSDQHGENLVRLELRKRRLNSTVIIYRFVFYILLNYLEFCYQKILIFGVL